MTQIHGNRLNYYRKQARLLLDKLSSEEHDNAKYWYQEAHHEAMKLCRQHNITLNIAAQVIATLSPAVSWQQNLKDANNLIAGFNKGIQNLIRVSTYKANKRKAIAILYGDKTLEPSAMKTYAFYTNILTAGNNNNVTVDRHAYKALNNIAKGGSIKPTKAEYEELEIAYQILAREYGLTPPQMQAVVWVAYKKQVRR